MYLLLKRLPDDVKGYSITMDRDENDVETIRIGVKRISIDARRSLFDFKPIQSNVERFYIDVKRIEIAAEAVLPGPLSLPLSIVLR